MQAVRNVIDFGRWAWGNESWPSSQRFLYRCVGDTFLLRSGHAATGHTPLEEDTLEDTLTMPLDQLWRRPVLMLQTMLDHNCTSYSHDIGTAARLQQRQGQRQLHAGAEVPHTGTVHAECAPSDARRDVGASVPAAPAAAPQRRLAGAGAGTS